LYALLHLHVKTKFGKQSTTKNVFNYFSEIIFILRIFKFIFSFNTIIKNNNPLDKLILFFCLFV